MRLNLPIEGDFGGHINKLFVLLLSVKALRAGEKFEIGGFLRAEK